MTKSPGRIRTCEPTGVPERRAVSPAEVRAKAEEYLQAGVQIVWIIEPDSKRVTVFRAKERAREFKIGDTLTAKGVIPGFKVPVAELFDK